ncbi:FAD-dependent monooxygenase [Actinoplanes sp. NPDC051851]|uniref:FAD-dependent monooxygenase n=1 Tax=Actinoplanes sp. NPDC051851 TaxID=3154753 RepID=UPI0034461538
MEFDVDVVVAGAGPNGLMVAAELALAGVRPLILERRIGPSQEQRANGLVGQVVPMLHRRGLYERLAGREGDPEPLNGFVFGAFPLALTKAPETPLHVIQVPQRRIEEMLRERVAELGVELREGHELTGLEQREHGVVIEVDGIQRITARYLVGADGGRSVTRKLAGIGFPGVTNDDAVSRSAHVSVPVEYRDPASGGLIVPGYGTIPPFMHHRTERGLIAYAVFQDGRTLLSVSTTTFPEPPEPFTLDELHAVAEHVLGVDIPFGPPTGDGPHLLRRLSGGNTRIAERYREGRVILLGDAAHVHSAIGGPGLNLGLQDAINLGWKLAATVRGWAPEDLLDTYESERRPAAERVTMHTQAQGLLSGPGPQVTALRTLFAELLEEPAVVRHIAAMMAGSDVTYAVTDGPAHPGEGRLAPPLGAFTHSGRPLLITERADLAAVAANWSDRVDVVAVPGTTSMLVRPDNYVAWARNDTASLESALDRWFGKAAVSSGSALPSA